jgi:hypothetical protein
MGTLPTRPGENPIIKGQGNPEAVGGACIATHLAPLPSLPSESRFVMSLCDDAGFLSLELLLLPDEAEGIKHPLQMTGDLYKAPLDLPTDHYAGRMYFNQRLIVQDWLLLTRG